MILAVDPSIRSAGMALFDSDPACTDGLIFAARVTMASSGADPAERERAMARRILAAIVSDLRGIVPIDRLVSERPQIYAEGGGRTKGDPNDMLFMVGVTAALAALLPGAACTTYRPAEWKGQMPKAAVEARVRQRLSPAEAARLPASHDAIEAVGIGLFYLGRFAPRRVYPGAT